MKQWGAFFEKNEDIPGRKIILYIKAQKAYWYTYKQEQLYFAICSNYVGHLMLNIPCNIILKLISSKINKILLRLKYLTALKLFLI